EEERKADGRHVHDGESRIARPGEALHEARSDSTAAQAGDAAAGPARPFGRLPFPCGQVLHAFTSRRGPLPPPVSSGAIRLRVSTTRPTSRYSAAFLNASW